MIDFKALQKAVYDNKVAHGWNVTNIHEEFCLLQTEITEAYHAYFHETPEAFAEELADVAIYLMGMAEIAGVDLETAAGLARRFDGEGLDRLRERCFSPREQAAYPRTAEGFACCWTRKEALFKCAGGRAFRPEQYDSLNSQVMTCVIKEECGPILSVCGQNAAQPHLYLTDGTRFRPADWREAGPV